VCECVVGFVLLVVVGGQLDAGGMPLCRCCCACFWAAVVLHMHASVLLCGHRVLRRAQSVAASPDVPYYICSVNVKRAALLQVCTAHCAPIIGKVWQ